MPTKYADFQKRYYGAPDDSLSGNDTFNTSVDSFVNKYHSGTPEVATADTGGNPFKSLGGIAKKIATPEVLANVAMPLLGIAEVIATKGKSQGDYALNAQATLNKGMRDKEEREQTARDRALSRKKAQLDIDAALRGIENADTQKKARERTAAIVKEFDFGALIGRDISPEMNKQLQQYYSDNPGEVTKVFDAVVSGKYDLAMKLMEEKARVNEVNQANKDEALELRKRQIDNQQSNAEVKLQLQEQGLELKRMKDEAALKGKEEAQKKAQEGALKLKQEIVDLSNDILKDPGFATGLNPMRLMSAAPGSKEFTFRKKVENLKNRLTLEQREKLRGQGQISDKESKMLENAASMLDMGLNRNDFIKEIQRIQSTVGGGAGDADPLGIR